MTANAPTFKCARCGACCTHLFVYATPEDVLREPRIAERSIRADRDGSSSLMQSQWWLARGNPCPFLTNQECAIYPTRPHDCVAFMPGSTQCTEARETANLPPLEPLPASAERTLADEICAAALLQQGRAAASAR